MKRLLTIVTVTIILAGCSSMPPQSTEQYIDAVLSFEELKQADGEIQALAAKYYPLLNEVERVKSTEVYKSIKDAGDNFSIETPLKYKIAKRTYISDFLPIYEKYEPKIEAADNVIMKAKHEKLKNISQAIDTTESIILKNNLQAQYITLALRAAAIIAAKQ